MPLFLWWSVKRKIAAERQLMTKLRLEPAHPLPIAFVIFL